jgi:transcriptional repressor NrdR
MQCKHCGYPKTAVVETESSDVKNITRRRRECLRCGVRFTTHERIRDDNNNNKQQAK